MLKHYLLCLLLVCGGAPGGPQAGAKGDRPARPRGADALARAAEQVKALDEPVFRVFLRLRLAKHLWSQKSGEAARVAEAAAADALADLQTRGAEMPGLYAGLFRRELLAALELNAPALAGRLAKQYGLDDDAVGDDTAYELLTSGAGTAKAVEMMRRSIKSGRPGGPPRLLIFFLSRLDETRPAETNGLLADLLGVMEAAPDRHPVSALFTFAHNYLYREATPPELKARFLALLVRASADPAALSEGERRNAYNLLKVNLHAVEKLLPALYAQAGAQTASLASLVGRETAERGEAYDRARANGESIEQLLDEAKKTQDAAFRAELLTRAAHLVLDKGQFKSAVDLFAEATAGIKHRDEKFYAAHQDQFLAEVARKAVEKRDAESAAHAAARMDDPLKRAPIVLRLALYHQEAQDPARAAESLADAVKLMEGAEDGSRKASALLTAVGVALRIDRLRATELAQSAVKAVNNLPDRRPGEKAGGEAHLKHVEMLMNVSYHLLPLFERLSRQDEVGALGLAGKLRQPELRAVAALGVAQGVDAEGGEKPAAARPK